jgi:N-acetylglucosaminyl-diphospho-decaprenol L-rhamnosyltransferase
MMNKATISIVSYCQKNLLDRCLAQIDSLSLPSGWHTIVVDNNSPDGSADMVEQRYPRVTLVRLQENLGYGGGHNVAYAQTDGEYFFVLNPDVVVLAGSLEVLVQTLSEFSKAAIVGPCLLNPDGSSQFSARRFYTWGTIVCRRFPIPGRKRVNDYHLMKDQDLSRLLRVDWILGAAMGIRRSAFSGNELFDPRYKLYFEDVDLCYFAQKRGWDVLYCPSSKMIHDHQRVSGRGGFNRAKLCHFTSWVKFYQKSKGRFEPA